MRLGVISDTHDELARTQIAIKILLDEGAEAIAHCGDVCSPRMVEVIAVRPSWFVFGNNDADMVPWLREAIVEAGGTCLEWSGEVTLAEKRVAIAHGHMNYDVRGLLASQPHYLLSGHSHVAEDRLHGMTRRINPGALHRADEYSVALIDLDIDEVKFLKVPR